MRVVADTNVLISAILFGGLPEAFLELASLRSFQLVTSPTLLEELDGKLRLKFLMPDEDANEVRWTLEEMAVVVRPDLRLTVVKSDPDDDRVLECALAGEADYIVSGDKHLRELGSYDGIKIVTVRQFMDTIEG